MPAKKKSTPTGADFIIANGSTISAMTTLEVHHEVATVVAVVEGALQSQAGMQPRTSAFMWENIEVCRY